MKPAGINGRRSWSGEARLCGLNKKESLMKSLYERLGGYEGISAFANDLLPRLQADPQLGRYWQNRGDDGIAREKQLLVDYLCSSAGGPVYYTGRDMKLTHQGMKISESDWSKFLEHAGATMKALQVPQSECDEVVAFFLSLKKDIVEV
jgi:hemoglobin